MMPLHLTMQVLPTKSEYNITNNINKLANFLKLHFEVFRCKIVVNAEFYKYKATLWIFLYVVHGLVYKYRCASVLRESKDTRAYGRDWEALLTFFSCGVKTFTDGIFFFFFF